MFKNPYAPAPASAILEIEKKYAGDKPEKDETFDFTLKAVNTVDDGSYVKGSEDKIVSGDLWKVSITGEGKTTFSEIEYCKAGVYTYELTEVSGSAENWIYSTSKWIATVTVTDKDGSLETEVKYECEEETRADRAVFTNTYDNPPPPPPTGDQTHMLRYILLMAISMFLLVFMLFGYKRTRRAKHF